MLISTASTWNLFAGTPPSSSAITNEKGSSPEAQATLSTRNRGVGWTGSHSSRTRRTKAAIGSGSRKNQVSDTTTDSTNSFHSAGECSKRSEEHTSELQSLRHLVCRLLLE